MTFQAFLLFFGFSYITLMMVLASIAYYMKSKRKKPKYLLMSEDIDFERFGWKAVPGTDPKEFKHTKENYMLRLEGSVPPYQYWRFFKLEGNKYREVKRNDGSAFELRDTLTNEDLEAFELLTKKYVALRPSWWSKEKEKERLGF